ncbi:MAG: hypothetical protein COA42_23750 [Alteromonadaceae bacterium]|nr:MAG: hypothetical protein COA42_23750 [Alteromonadaceae bacterium]
MSAWAKQVAVVGDGIVTEFLTLIGWNPAKKEQRISCILAQKHGGEDNHTLDYLYSYHSQLENQTINHLLVAVEYNTAAYPANPNTKFKDYFYGLAKSIECFKRASIRKTAAQELDAVENTRDIGVLMWLCDDTDCNQDIVKKVATVRVTDEFPYETIYICDNHRASFIYDSMKTLEAKFPGANVEFFYPNTGRNFNPSSRKSSGKILPVEFINSSVQIFKITDENGDKIFAISVIEPFNIDHLKRLLGLAQEITSDFASSTYIAFPDFDTSKHQSLVDDAKADFSNQSFSKSVTVISFRDDSGSAGDE